MRFVLLVLIYPLLGGCAAGVLLGGGRGGEAAVSRPAESDQRITAEVNRRFVNDPQISAMSIHVQTHQGIVTLNGSVSNHRIGAQAERTARAVPGVRGVRNYLRVKQ
jgi:osmotically-inducible protein OsmY